MHGVIGAADFDMVVLMDFGADLPLGVFVAARGQRLRQRSLLGVEDALSASLALLERRIVDLGNDLGDRGIELR